MDDTPVEKRAKELFELGFYCAESVLKAVAEHAGIDSPLIPKIATGFCGGISRSKGLCGAVSGGVIALGMIFGRNSPDVPSDKTYSKVQEFLATFQNQYGSLNCFDLIGCDFNMETERQRWKKTGLENKCKEFTAVSARIIIEIVAKEKVDS